MPGILLNNAYNHYLTTYASKEVSQSDTHKKEDLRGVYRSIIKSNQKNPTHLTGQNDHAEESAIDLKESARRMQRTLASLGDIGQEKALSSRSAFSSNESMVTARYIGNEEDDPPSFTVKVEQLANEQINTGKTMPKGEAKLAPGSYAFNIRMDGQVYELQYSVKSGESNKDIQERLSRLINKAGIGIKADVSDAGGKTTMTLTSATTGAGTDSPEQFKITEESDSGMKGTVSYFGLDRMTQIPHDARFKINGTSHTSASNHFTVSKMYELTLTSVGATDDESFIGIKDKQESMVDHVHTLVDSYNTFLNNISNISSVKVRTGKITADSMRAAKTTLGDAEESIGISLSDNGKLLVDEVKLHAASEISADQLDETMKPVRDFAKSLYSISKDIALNPMQYIDRPVVAYKDPSKDTAPNPYLTSEYSGMLFNNYC